MNTIADHLTGRSSIILILLALSLCCLGSENKKSGAQADNGPEKLIYMCEDIPPSNYLEHGELKGISVEMLRLVWKQMGVPSQTIKIVPWARGYHTVQSQSNCVLFSMTRTRERERLFKWVGPIFTVKNVLMGRTDKILKIDTIDAAKKLRIGTIKDDVLEKYLLQSGFLPDKIDGVAAMEQNFDKLRAGRIDCIAHTEQTLRQYIRNNKLDQDGFRVFFVLSDSPNYYAFSRETPDTLIQQFQKALEQLADEHHALLERYGLSP
ncbi:MAG: transporter substrate-binding domain-containing protein [Spirochaetes bacterium]|nr:transporter substrate-binding domain-containing protein [Spirochaetota bacterium]